MKLLITIFTLVTLLSCNKIEQAKAPKQPLEDDKSHIKMIQQMQRRITYLDTTSSVVIFHWPKAMTWETDYYNKSMSGQAQFEKMVEGVQFYSDLHDKIEERIDEIVQLSKKWEDEYDCETYIDDEVDPSEWPYFCLKYKDEYEEWPDEVEDLFFVQKLDAIDNVRKQLDYDIEKAFHWKVHPDDKSESIFEFGTKKELNKENHEVTISDWQTLNNVELNKFGPLKLSYTTANGGIRNVSIDDNYMITFYLYEKTSFGGPLTGNVYKYELAQNANFLERHRLKGNIHLYDANLNLIKKEIGICKIEFENAEKRME